MGAVRGGCTFLENRCACGEAVNALKRAIYTGRVSPAQRRRVDETQAVADALSLLANIVMAWNTTQMQAVTKCRAPSCRRRAAAPRRHRPDLCLRLSHRLGSSSRTPEGYWVFVNSVRRVLSTVPPGNVPVMDTTPPRAMVPVNTSLK